MNKKIVIFSVVGIALVWQGFHLLGTSSVEPTDSINQPIAVNQTSSAAVSTNVMRPADVVKRTEIPSAEILKQRYAAFMANRPLYLADTDLPAQYSVDENGNLVVDAAVKDILDYFMMAIGDLPFDQIHDLIAGNMLSSLQEPALSQALAILDSYFTYIDAYDTWEQSFDKNQMVNNDPANMKNTLGELADLQRQYLGEDVYNAFFAEKDQMNEAYVDAQIALKQPGLSESERSQIVEQLKAALPEDVREAQEAAMTQVNLDEKTQALIAHGASQQDIYQTRVAMVGEEAAKRLQAVDESEHAWDQKRAQYKQLFTSVPGTEGLSAADRDSYVADLAQKQLGLSANEIKRMQALDRIDAAESVQ